ncbi:MAG: flagellin [Planctomycetota bacterium]
MAVGPITPRTTLLLTGSTLTNNLLRTQAELFDAERQIQTGKQINKPSDAPGKISTLNALNEQIEARAQYTQNLTFAQGLLTFADQSLADATDILIEAQATASSQVGVGSDADTRQAMAFVVDEQLAGLIEAANRQFNGISLFGGDNGAAADGDVFVDFLGGVRYLGGSESLNLDIGSSSSQALNSNGIDAFGALSSRVRGTADLDPQATDDVRLADIDGADARGFRPGSVEVTIDGTAVTVDLTTADTLGDVVTRINDAIDGVDPAAGTIAATGTGLTLTANAGHTISIADLQSGNAALDLGIDGTTATGASVAGSDLRVRLDELTNLADLGATIDFASGLTITQGLTTKTADFSAATTIQDLQNDIDDLDLGVRRESNDAGDGLDRVSEVSGIALSVGENGGTTANDLGIATFGAATQLADFRDGLGIETVDGDDLSFTLHDGTTFFVDISGVLTVDELMTAIQSAADAATVAAGDLTVSLAATGTGLVFTDSTAGAEDFVIANAGLSNAAEQLGILGNAGAGTTINGTDEATVKVESAFTALAELADALRRNDALGITLAGGKVEDRLDGVVNARALVGVDSRRVQDLLERSADMDIADRQLRSLIEDADLTEVISRYGQLQTQLQASLQVGSISNQLSLLDFLG